MTPIALRLALYLSVCLSVASPAHAATALNLDSYTPACKKAVLESLGWQISTDASVATPQMSQNSSCWQTAPEKLYSAQLKFPTAMSIGQYDAALNRAFNDDATTCNYQKYNAWAMNASEQMLRKNWTNFFVNPVGNYVSSYSNLGNADAQMQFLSLWQKKACENKDGNINDDTLEAPRWVYTHRDGKTVKKWVTPNKHAKCFVPAENQIHAAIRQLGKGVYETDCSTGLELIQYSAIDYLFGEKIDQYFTPEDFYVGTNYWDSGSILGQNARYEKDFSGLGRAIKGPNGLIGASGIVFYQKSKVNPKTGVDEGAQYLDDPLNMGENFVIAKMSQNAVTYLISRGGVTGYDRILRQIWESLEKLTPYQIKQLLLSESIGEKLDPKITPSASSPEAYEGAFNFMPPEADPNYASVARLLNDPFLSETTIYVHPVGFKTFAWHLARLALKNPRTPYSIQLFPDHMHAAVFDRWLKMKLDSCGH